MNILGCLDRPTRGQYVLAGLEVGGRSGDARAIVRNRLIGFVFQGFNLLARATALENVELPLRYRGVSARVRRKLALDALEAVGLAERVHHTPNRLSGGQQQRVAIARALVTAPPLLLADEPTGNLDTRTSLEVLALLQRLNKERGITIVIVTHEHDIARCASRVITMRDGNVVSDVRCERPADASQQLADLPSAADGGDQLALAGGVDAGPVAARRVPAAVIGLMGLGELVGVQATLGYAGFVLHVSPVSCLGPALFLGELAKAVAGSMGARRRLGAPPDGQQRFGMAFTYTIAVTCPTAALAVLAAMRFPSSATRGLVEGLAKLVEGNSLHSLAVLTVLAFGSLWGLVLLRYLMLTMANPRR